MKFTSRNIAVLGACGDIGYEVCRALLEEGPVQLVMADHDPARLDDLSERLSWIAQETRIAPVAFEGDRLQSLSAAFKSIRPEIVFLAADLGGGAAVHWTTSRLVQCGILEPGRVADLSVASGVRLLAHVYVDEPSTSAAVMCSRIAENHVRLLAFDAGLQAMSCRLGSGLLAWRSLDAKPIMSQLVNRASGMCPGSRDRLQSGPHRYYDVRLESRAIRCSERDDAYLPFSDLGDIRRRLAILRRLADRGDEERLSRLLGQFLPADH